ncbi:hypothetical protein [Paenibacillus sp. Cedars]|uniref:hypothetical protein n=1 Tax=Paenibacillus sp. Cedars TaxID=1980674 RepID=UPI001561EB4E|nr:hypothetical protein [Paenibacillus sp. Cedars]
MRDNLHSCYISSVLLIIACCVVLAFPSAHVPVRRDQVHVRVHRDQVHVQVRPDATGRVQVHVQVRPDAKAPAQVHAQVRPDATAPAQDIQVRRPDNLEGMVDKDRLDNTVDSMDKDSTDIRGSDPGYQGLFGFEVLFYDGDSSHAPLSIR